MNSNPKAIAQSVDAFHRGRFVVIQPQGTGHRSGIDAMLLAGAVPSNVVGKIVDFGAGAGAAGLAVLSRCAGANVTLVEKDPIMVAFAKATLDHTINKDFTTRASVIESDVTNSGGTRVATGLFDNHFDFAIMNPPFNLAHDRQTPDALKADAHVMAEDMFETWLRTAAATLKSRGTAAIIARPQSLADIMLAMKGRFGALRILPIHARSHEPAIRIIVTGIKGSRAGLTLEPSLILHARSGNALLPDANAICNGLSGLYELGHSDTL